MATAYCPNSEPIAALVVVRRELSTATSWTAKCRVSSTSSTSTRGTGNRRRTGSCSYRKLIWREYTSEVNRACAISRSAAPTTWYSSGCFSGTSDRNVFRQQGQQPCEAGRHIFLDRVHADVDRVLHRILRRIGCGRILFAR